MKRLVPAFLLLFLLAPAAGAGESGPIKVPSKEKCPVCGMFVYKYPDWVCQVRFQDGAIVYFDGAKDMFKFLFKPDRYAPGRKREEISDIRVTEYYNLEAMAARDAWFVVGSDVFGPMGKELVPLDGRESAETFMADHQGQAILRFEEVTPQVVAGLD
jgi:nitrous oxide reductase accessory protein NosL